MAPPVPDDEDVRWYDRDPALRRAMAQLREAGDRYQAQVALNLIKIIVEHQSASEGAGDGDTPDTEALRQALAGTDTPQARARRRRWYDVNETLRSAMVLLKECPTDVQQSRMPAIVAMIEDTLAALYNPN